MEYLTVDGVGLVQIPQPIVSEGREAVATWVRNYVRAAAAAKVPHPHAKERR